MIPMPAQYLLRLDDLCPMVSLSRLNRFLPLIDEFGLHPILAVVPDNMDPELERSPSDPEFWARMRAMEAAGATVALHGYRHVCNSRGASLVPMHSQSEFAGVPEETQQEWIRTGLAILRDHGLNPRMWVAPRHGFDGATLRALHKEGIVLLSDGFARVPFLRGGVTWIPQQLWAPVEKNKGLWTICVHSNTAGSVLVDQLKDFLARHAAEFTQVDRVLAETQIGKLGPVEQLHETLALLQIRTSRWRKRRQRLRSIASGG